MPAAEVQAELLATYGVEVLPHARVEPKLRPPRFEPRRLLFDAVNIFGALIKLAIVIVVGLVLAMASLTILALVVGLVIGDRGDVVPSVSPAVSPSESGTAGVSPLRGMPPPAPPEKRAVPIAEVGIVCGIGQGHQVALEPCDAPVADLIGWAERTTPEGAGKDCVVRSDAYSRGAHYWICWSDTEGRADVRPWARAPNPFLVPASEGGVLHGDR